MLEIKKGLQAIFWDFDGVLMDSNPVRNLGFEKVLSGYPAGEVKALLDFHKANGGLSRYVKFRYFFEQIRNENISESEVQVWADKFSVIVKEMLLNKSLLINETLLWVTENYKKIPMHIVSGSDQRELRSVCEHHNISRYFRDINGSPTPKKQLVAGLLSANKYTPSQCLLVGDSINDYEAAEVNGVSFLPYNNPAIAALNTY
jgi:phosphoglycolate phosphatase-like HAD superfamily hydrolase